jgi:hypothetical protein
MERLLTNHATNRSLQRTQNSRVVALGLVALALTGTPTSAVADSEEPYLIGDRLIASFAGATLIGSNWAEYYAPDGSILGKVRYLGVLHEFNGRWTVKRDEVCFEYDRSEYNTCSRFRRSGDRMRHFGPDGKPKADGESRRLPGNRLAEFR